MISESFEGGKPRIAFYLIGLKYRIKYFFIPATDF